MDEVKLIEEHSAKTRMSEFLERYPNAVVFAAVNFPVVKPCDIDYSVKERLCKNGFSCAECRKKYWSESIG